MIFVAGCELPQKPGELWWDVDLNIPFGVRQYGIWELADPDTTLRRLGSGVGMEDDSSVYFSAWAELSAAISESLHFEPLSLTIERPVTAVEAPLGYDTLLEFTLGQLNQDIAALHGTTQDIPEHILGAVVSLPLPFGYDSLEVDTGSIELIIANRLPYAASGIEIRVGNTIIATIASLAPEQQVILDESLDDATLTTGFDLSLTATGLGGQSILIDSTDRISLTARIDTITASRFYGLIPEQTVTRDSALAIEQQHDIDVVIISAGNMIITLSNHTQLSDTVTLRIPNLVSRLNDTLIVTRFLLSGDSDVVTVPLTQYRLRPDGETNQTITGQIISHSQATTDVRSFVGISEIVFGRLQLEELSLEYFSGTLHNLELSFDSLSIDIERPPQGWEVVRPIEVEARVHVDQGIGGVIDAEINTQTWLNGIAFGSSVITIDELPLVDDTMAVIPGLAHLLADYPDQLTANGTASLSGDVSIFNNTEIALALEMRAALAVILTDTLSPVGVVERVNPQDLEDIISGEATIKLWNHLPLGGRCFLIADRDSANIIEGSTADVDTLFDVDIPRPTLVNGRAVSASEFEFVIELDERWLDYFRLDQFFVRTQITVSNGIGDSLVVYGGDYLSVQALAKLVYTVRPGGVE